MADIQVFQNPAFGQVRVVMHDNEPWFVATDICEALSLNRTQTRRLDDDEKGVRSIHTLGGTQKMTCVNEPGLYSLVLASRKPEAKQFKRWLTHEVIPAIRKHGGYLTPDKVEEALLNPDTIIKLAQALKDEQAKNVALTRDRDYLQNKVNTTALPQLAKKRTRATANDYTITDVAHLYDVSPKKLFDLLREHGWLMQEGGRGMHYPTGKAPIGCFYVEMRSFGCKTSMTIRVTEYGLLSIKELLQAYSMLPWYK